MRQLRAQPSNGSAPFLLVAEGDLTPDDEAALSTYGAYPYAIVLGVTENARGRGLSASSMGSTTDVILEQQPINDKRPPKRGMAELRDAILQAAKEVNELEHGVPLTSIGGRHLRYTSGSPIGAKYQANTVLTCTLRFTCSWAGHF